MDRGPSFLACFPLISTLGPTAVFPSGQSNFSSGRQSSSILGQTTGSATSIGGYRRTSRIALSSGNGQKTPHIVGSSPRVRGTCLKLSRIQTPVRFIPAGAGNIRDQVQQQIGSTVHPRGCGEHTVERPLWPCFPGSSPRVRGTSRNNTMCINTNRFIPAGAGNMWGRSQARNRIAVHPRGCGEHAGMSNPLC